jgi:osmotically-inducible protein OsmY
MSGGRVFLHGTVASEEVREALAEVASEAAPGREICNQTSVVVMRPAEEAEELS